MNKGDTVIVKGGEITCYGIVTRMTRKKDRARIEWSDNATRYLGKGFFVKNGTKWTHNGLTAKVVNRSYARYFLVKGDTVLVREGSQGSKFYGIVLAADEDKAKIQWSHETSRSMSEGIFKRRKRFAQSDVWENGAASATVVFNHVYTRIEPPAGKRLTRATQQLRTGSMPVRKKQKPTTPKAPPKKKAPSAKPVTRPVKKAKAPNTSVSDLKKKWSLGKKKKK